MTAPADAALAAAAGRRGRRNPGPAPSLQREAEAWLRDRLAAGPVPVGEAGAPTPGTLAADLALQSWSWRTLRRASDAIGVVKVTCPQTGGFVWQLPPKPEKPEEPETAAPMDGDGVGPAGAD